MQQAALIQSIREKLYAYGRLMRFDRPIGTFLLLWPTLWAVYLAAQGKPSLKIIVIFTLGVIIMRAAGSVINDIADRNIDGHVARTKQRPLVTGDLSTKEALGLFLGLLLCALCLVLLLNPLSLYLAVMSFLLATIYPFSKRFFACPQLVLGLTWSCGLLMAFTAQQNSVPPLAWLLYLTHICLTIAYDTMYAMVDRDDDLMIGVKSSAILFGTYDRLAVALLQGATLGLLLLVGRVAELALTYYVLLIPAAGLLLYQQYLIKDRKPEQCFKAFLSNSWFGFIVLMALIGA